MNTVVIVSANAEWQAVKPLFPSAEFTPYPFGEYFTTAVGNRRVTFFHTGWGKIASAGALQYIIDHHQPDLIVNLGTCGGLEGVTRQGDVILVERTFVYDVVEQMGDLDISTCYASSLDLGWLREPLPFPARRGLIASADSDLPPAKTAFLKSKGVLAADWESAALAWVAQKNNARLLILRAVSDMVSEEGGEAYNNIEIFHNRAKTIMEQLVSQLPGWLDAVRL